MSDQVPMFLYEASLSLYPLAQDGTPLRQSPLWWGAVANNLRLSLEYDEVRLASSGDAFQSAHHVDEQHLIEIERTWLLRKVFPEGQPDFVPRRNGWYALEIIWASEGLWYRRTYFNVTGRAVSWDSQGAALQFGNRQSFRATNYQQDADYVQPPVSGGSAPPPTLPPVLPPGSVTTPLLPDEQSVGFFHEAPMVTGEYLLGQYRWARNVQLNGAKVVAFAPQGSPSVLTLELNGVLTTQSLAIPVGAANTEVSASLDLGGLLVPAGQVVRWKITGGPAPENAAWVAALALQVQPLPS